MSIERAHRKEEMREEQEENTSSMPSTPKSFNLEKNNNFNHPHKCWRLSREAKEIETPILEGGYKSKKLEDNQDDMYEGKKINWWVHLELSNNQDKKQASCIHYRRK
jgi:hypothetical protein